MTMPADLALDVSDAAGERATQAAWLFLPGEPADTRAVVICFHGASYDKHYWHYEMPGYPDYSFATHLAARGYVVIAVDHLGAGQSTDPRPGRPRNLALLASAGADVVRQVREQVAQGSLAPGVPVTSPVIGVGHSLGAAVVITMQERARSFDGVALLGLGIHISDVQESPLDHSTQAAEDMEASLRTSFGVEKDAVSMMLPRGLVRQVFHAPDVPDAVVTFDDALQSRTSVRAGAETVTQGFLAEAAGAIDVPVLLAFGTVVDMSDNPHAEPRNYPRSPDVTLYMVQGAGHCHNLAGKRQALWDRIASWIPATAATASR
jgi:alpha-beta hydrolase superfamily lysophospholipase